jgi:hypothetical protein
MADHPELQAKLQELDHELEEGDITQKGFVSICPTSPSHASASRPGAHPQM